MATDVPPMKSNETSRRTSTVPKSLDTLDTFSKGVVVSVWFIIYNTPVDKVTCISAMDKGRKLHL